MATGLTSIKKQPLLDEVQESVVSGPQVFCDDKPVPFESFDLKNKSSKGPKYTIQRLSKFKSTKKEELEEEYPKQQVESDFKQRCQALVNQQKGNQQLSQDLRLKRAKVLLKKAQVPRDSTENPCNKSLIDLQQHQKPIQFHQKQLKEHDQSPRLNVYADSIDASSEVLVKKGSNSTAKKHKRNNAPMLIDNFIKQERSSSYDPTDQSSQQETIRQSQRVQLAKHLIQELNHEISPQNKQIICDFDNIDANEQPTLNDVVSKLQPEHIQRNDVTNMGRQRLKLNKVFGAGNSNIVKNPKATKCISHGRSYQQQRTAVSRNPPQHQIKVSHTVQDHQMFELRQTPSPENKLQLDSRLQIHLNRSKIRQSNLIPTRSFQSILQSNMTMQPSQFPTIMNKNSVQHLPIVSPSPILQRRNFRPVNQSQEGSNPNGSVSNCYGNIIVGGNQKRSLSNLLRNSLSQSTGLLQPAQSPNNRIKSFRQV